MRDGGSAARMKGGLGAGSCSWVERGWVVRVRVGSGLLTVMMVERAFYEEGEGGGGSWACMNGGMCQGKLGRDQRSDVARCVVYCLAEI